jgi:hypothetical protein
VRWGRVLSGVPANFGSGFFFFHLFAPGSSLFPMIIRCAKSSILLVCARKLLIRPWSHLFSFRSFSPFPFPTHLSFEFCYKSGALVRDLGAGGLVKMFLRLSQHGVWLGDICALLSCLPTYPFNFSSKNFLSCHFLPRTLSTQFSDSRALHLTPF